MKLISKPAVFIRKASLVPVDDNTVIENVPEIIRCYTSNNFNIFKYLILVKFSNFQKKRIFNTV